MFCFVETLDSGRDRMTRVIEHAKAASRLVPLGPNQMELRHPPAKPAKSARPVRRRKKIRPAASSDLRLVRSSRPSNFGTPGHLKDA